MWNYLFFTYSMILLHFWIIFLWSQFKNKVLFLGKFYSFEYLNKFVLIPLFFGTSSFSFNTTFSSSNFYQFVWFSLNFLLTIFSQLQILIYDIEVILLTWYHLISLDFRWCFFISRNRWIEFRHCFYTSSSFLLYVFIQRSLYNI